MKRPLVLICEGTGMSFSRSSPMRALASEARLHAEVVPYPSTFVPFPYDEMARQGRDMAVSMANHLLFEDPERPIVLLGYSLGARIAGDALVRLARRHDNVSGVLVSDPRQPGTGVEIRRGGQRWPGVSFTGERDPIHAPVLRIAHAGDPICSDAGFLGYFLHHSAYHRMNYGGGRLFEWVAHRLASPPDRTVVVR